MRLLCFSKLVFVLLFPLCLWSAPNGKSAIFYYGRDISWPLVGAHDYIVVQPENTDVHTHGFKTYRPKVYAYVSVGEVESGQWYYPKIDTSWKIGHNLAWKSDVMDLSSRAYRDFLLDEVIGRLREKGFENIFLDTLDSYRIAATESSEQKRQRLGLVSLIKEIRHRWPDIKIMLNRGFELLPDLKGMITAVAAESLFHGIGGENLAYEPVKKRDREWLSARMRKAASEGIDVIDIEYLPQEKLYEQGPELLKRVSKEGFIGYVSGKDLTRYGITNRKVLKREILMLYDGTRFAKEDQAVHMLASLPVEYLGYIPILSDIRRGLPEDAWERFSGAILWLDRPYAQPKKLADWIVKNSLHGVNSLILGLFPIPSESYGALKTLGIKTVQNLETIQNTHVLSVEANDMMNYETPINPLFHETMLEPNAENILYGVTNGKRQKNVLAALMPWGGYAVEEASIVEFNGDNIWTIDPFRLFSEALHMRPIPVPDPTTENGRRLLFTHIDGDAFIDKAEWNSKIYVSEVIRDEILSRYHIPHSVSVVEGEIAPYGLYPKISKKMESIARSIYRLLNVEAATHTFSHPFIWGKIDKNGDLPVRYRLPIKNYTFSLDRELAGSLRYINTKLLPAHKPKARTVFWSGDCMPPLKVLDYVYRHDLLNINGGDTHITKAHPWLSYIAPLGIRKGPYWQIYCGVQNENLYTNNWHGPFWGFKNVIETYQMTDRPRRFKPIDIYYHFYSGSKRAPLNALKAVFDWAVKRDVMPIYTSEYIPKVMEYYDASIAHTQEGWQIYGLRELRTLRLEDGRLPNIALSDGVIGYKKSPQGLYLHLSGGEKKELHYESGGLSAHACLISSNGKTMAFWKNPNGFSAHFASHVPLETVIMAERECRIVTFPKNASIVHHGDRVSVRYEREKEARIDVRCP
ncbi:endo alpha-1,4 polygalactosaminidase [Hydrogenimonas sp.]